MLNAIIVLLCLVVLAVLLIPVLAPRHRGAPTLKDATQIRGIHQAWLVFARDFDRQMPIPGLVDRLPVNGVEEPGRGEEDITQNTTANLYSLGVIQNYFTPEICISPSETNPRVAVFDAYNYNAYLPAQGIFWDSTFMADLQVASHTSYAHMPLIEVWKQHWRESLKPNPSWPIIGNRGPLNGVHDPKSYTNGLHEPRDQWSGNICFADNHVEFFIGLSTAKTTYRTTINTQEFRMDAADDPDGVLTFTKAMTPDGPVIQHD